MALAVLAACAAGRASSVPSLGASARSRGAEPKSPGLTRSNVEARDYAGSLACARCHEELARSFEASPMHRMTRLAATAEILAPFAGDSVFLGDDRATLETHAGDRFVRLDHPGSPSLLYRVTRVVGGHHREDFVGVRVDDYAGAPKFADRDEVVLPVSYLIAKRRLRYKGYSVMVPERPRLEAGPVWNRTCPFCHNTVPLLSTLLGALDGPKAPKYQGEVVDALLPPGRAFQYRVLDGAALEAAVGREVDRLGGDVRDGHLTEVLGAAIATTRHRFTGSKLLEVGIGCESCHGGSREHAADPRVHPSLLPRAPYLSVGIPAAGSSSPSPATIENHVCARCHQVLFSRYPWTWEGGRRNVAAGGSHINSGEARDLLLGGCQGALACTTCHDPHAADERARLALLETPAGNEVCLGCHGALRAKEALRAHAHHDPDGAGGACLACHLPKKNMSLEGRLTRYHRVGSPTDPDRVLNDRPIECGLCHGDKSVESLVTTMERWWTKRYDRDILRASYGTLDEPVLRATLRRGKPHEKAVALSLLGEAHDRGAGELFAGELSDPYPLVREFAADALHATFGPACDLHLERDAATRASEAARCSESAGIPVRTGAPNPGAHDAPSTDPIED